MTESNSKCPLCQKRFFNYTYNSEKMCDECYRNFLKAKIPSKYGNMLFDNYKVEKALEEQIEYAKKWLDNDYGLFITGPAGTGKTHLACALANAVLLKGKKINFISTPDLLNELRNSFSNEIEVDVILEKYTTGRMVLDDLGVEKSTDFVIESLYLLIDRRYRNNENKMIITSNLSLEEIGNKLSDRIASRICEMCDKVELKGQDYRLKINKDRKQ